LLVRRADHLLAIQRSATAWQRVRELMGFSFFSFLATLGNYARFYLDPVVIGRVLTIALITPFNIAAQLVEYFRVILQGVGAPLITSFSNLVGQKSDWEALQEVFLRATKLTALLSLFIGSLLLLDGEWFIRFWVGEQFLHSYDLVAVLTVAYVTLLGQIPSNSVLYAMNRHRALAAWTLVEGFAKLALSVYLARDYGLLGVALGTAIPMTFVAVLVQPWYVLRLLRLPARTYFSQALARPVASWALFVAICGTAGSWRPSGGVLKFLGAVGWQSAIFIVLAYWIGLSSTERRNLWERGRQLAAGLSAGHGAV
jgi:O-antigen/teichoic acid export membrane protein